jgi:UDP:flavonoid glycosyltransferase YjiC (YdhE family)
VKRYSYRSCAVQVSVGKRRIILSTLGSLGDLHPVLGLALGLRSRGHEVALATSEFYRARIETAGLEFHPLRPLAEPDDPRMLRRVLDSRHGPEYLIRTVLLPHLSDMYEDLVRATERADFLISGEVVVAAPLVAERRRLPWASAILAPFSFFSAHDPSAIPFLPLAPLLANGPPVIQRLLRAAARHETLDWGQPVNELRRSLGLPTSRHPLMDDRFSPFLNLALFSRVLGSPQPDWPGNTVQTGFVFHDAPVAAAADTALDAFLREGAPPVTLTLGSAAVMDPGLFFEEGLAAVRMLERRALLVMGKNPPPANLPASVLALDYAPYSEVFPRSACIVHQGGVGTTAQALRAGVPQLVMPFAFDQPDNAARVVRLGAGESIHKRRFQAPRVAKLLAKLLDTSRYAITAREAARQLSLENGLASACDAVEREMARHARHHSPVAAGRAATTVRLK